jgi:hypothetical protein
LRQAKVPVRWTNLTARHTGYADPAPRARKLERDIRLLTLDLEDRPDDPFVQRVRPIFKLFQGGQSLGDVSRHVRTRIRDARFSSSCSGPGLAVSDDAILGANLLTSPGLTEPGSPHELIVTISSVLGRRADEIHAEHRRILHRAGARNNSHNPHTRENS